MKSTAELEQEFDQFFLGEGFKKVTDLLSSPPDFNNADYVKVSDKIVVELKIIDKDFFQRGGIIHRLNTIVTVPQNVDSRGFGQHEFILPEINREGRQDSIEEPLRRILKKANLQLRETIGRLFSGQGIGYVMLALNMKTPINPEVIRKLVGELLAREFSSVSGFIVCTPTWGMHNPQTGQTHPLCLPTTPYGCSSEIRDNCVEIGKKWCAFAGKGGHK